MSRRSLVVSLIGRPNVGKSSIFNRLMRRGQKAITHDLPGVTRDRHYGIATMQECYELGDQDIILVDTGGFYPEPTKEDLDRHDNIKAFFNIMIDHGKLAISESDLILLVVDIREGLNPFDKMIVDFIRREKKEFLLLVNKYDSTKQEGDEIPFYELGIDSDQMVKVSAEHGIGLDSVREYVHKKAHNFSQTKASEGFDLQRGVKPRHDVVGSLAIVGSPNAGKSTLLNSLVGSKRALVSDIAGTTVDPIEAYIDLDFQDNVGDLENRENVFRRLDERLAGEYQDFLASQEPSQDSDSIEAENEAVDIEDFEAQEEEGLYSLEEQSDQVEDDEAEIEQEDEVGEEKQWVNTWRSLKIVDTAGIRKSGKVDGYLETQSVYSALRSITESDIVLYVVDSTKGITHQDRRLMDIALEKGKSIIICLNKVDLISETMQDRRKKNEWLLDMRYDIPWLSFCELVPISALKRSHFQRLRKAVVRTLLIRHRKVPTGKLNRLLEEMTERKPVILKGSRGQRFKVKYASMVKADPPTFILFCNKSQGVPQNYRRYLQNGIRNQFKLVNTPVHLVFRSGADLEKRVKKSTK